MSNNIDLVEKLKNCPRGTKLYSTIHGEVQLLEVKESDNDYPIIVVYNNIIQTFAKDGKFIIEHKDSECILFPSKDQRDWNDWEYIKLKKVKFNPNVLKPFDKVLVRDSSNAKWSCNLFSHINKESECIYVCDGFEWRYCIPYNNDTKPIVGTTNKAPEYYRYWED